MSLDAVHTWPLRLILKKLHITFFIFIFLYLNTSYFLLGNKYSSARSLLSLNTDLSVSIDSAEGTAPVFNNVSVSIDSSEGTAPVVNNVSVLLFPRIPKTGGTQFITLLKLMIPKTRLICNTYAGGAYNEDKEQYSIVPHEINDLHVISEDALRKYLEKTLIKDWREKAQIKPNASLYLLQYHLPFITVNQTDITSILHMESAMKWKYISMIRNPFDRIVSSFYYIRGQSGGLRSQNRKYLKNYVPKVIEMQKNSTIDECIESYDSGDNICHFSTNYYVKWFCGGDPYICNASNINQDSYNRAIQNIDTHFEWIGVLEYYKESVCLLYASFPLFFMHLPNSTVFDEKLEHTIFIMDRQREGLRYGKYQKASHQSIQILQRKNALDWKLYQYVIRKYDYHESTACAH